MSKAKKYLLAIIAVAFLSEIYFFPFTSELRFSVGIIALNLIILINDDISELRLSILCGIAVFVIRSILVVLFQSITIQGAIFLDFPALIYYMVFGFLAFITKVKKDKENLIKTIFLLAFIDSLSNVAETIMRSNISFSVVKIIVLAGIIRSFIAYFIYWFYKKQELYILAREHQKRYIQLNKLVSDIQAEMFYLKKSMVDIEDVMSKSYNLYESYKEDKILREKTLNISREVHEIKKDYYRVLKGFESFLRNFENDDKMTLADVFGIIRDNTNRYLTENNRIVKMHFKLKDNFILKNYYYLFSILNNLIINSIDACMDNDSIKIVQWSDEENIYFEVIDTGNGIEEEILPYVFNPGFTTKYDQVTGKPSTGIGLSHIKNIMENLKGDIEITSKINKGTTVKLIIPKNSLSG
ncbi:ATP-binding protein [Maledivibacter halophilus]|uniref:histidine kinase n=1 Tax=Maledivibacter halophilus TaxID=36842 RepID=A0A1T5L3N4_9FIRM|nr:ATP-binding protein [Maledivibacter halophilus]SKC70239.1 two-component system, sensor histidine kinase YcbA [Maledivibacter halophilus]